MNAAMLDEHQKALASVLKAYDSADEVEEDYCARILSHVESTPLWWHRDTLPGHVTASAFVVDPGLGQLLLHHHRRLDRWLQLGGHDEGERSPMRAVIREVKEESGLENVRFFRGPEIFDLDIHAIPETQKMAAHAHLDVRFLMVADPSERLVRQEDESRDLAWVSLEEAGQRMNEAGAWRVIRKIRNCGASEGRTR